MQPRTHTYTKIHFRDTGGKSNYSLTTKKAKSKQYNIFELKRYTREYYQGVRCLPLDFYHETEKAGCSQTHLFPSILNMLPGDQAAYKDLETNQEC